MENIIIVLFLALYLSGAARMSPVFENDSTENGAAVNDVISVINNSTEESSEENINSEYTDKLIEEIKARILKGLHKTQAPKRHAPLPVLQSLNFYHEIDEIEVSAQSNINTTRKTQTKFLYANVENDTCSDENGNLCVRFHFDLSLPVQNKDFASIELWLYKKQNVTEFTITRIISNSNQLENGRFTARLSDQTPSKGWIRFNVSRIVINENMTALDLEVSEENDELCLELGENKTPFLLIRTDATEERIFKRSIDDCTAENSTCCREKYYVKFCEMGWGDWIQWPEGYDANYCKGLCTTHVGLPQKHHGRVLMALCEKNPQKAREMGKTECISCSPTSYQSMSVIYLDEDGVQVVSHMPDMSVAKCGCI